MQQGLPTFPIMKIVVTTLVLFLIVSAMYYLYKKVLTEHLTIEDIHIPIKNKLGGVSQFTREREPVFE